MRPNFSLGLEPDAESSFVSADDLDRWVLHPWPQSKSAHKTEAVAAQRCTHANFKSQQQFRLYTRGVMAHTGFIHFRERSTLIYDASYACLLCFAWRHDMTEI